jgi:hypothetical protein
MTDRGDWMSQVTRVRRMRAVGSSAEDCPSGRGLSKTVRSAVARIGAPVRVAV